MKSDLNIAIVIPNYNGLALLKKYLSSVVKHSQGSLITIVDDCSTDQSTKFIKSQFPQINVVTTPKNVGFSGAVNLGFESVQADLVLLLNNDVELKADTISKLLPYFRDKKVFAVGAKEVLPRGERGRSKGTFDRGLLVHEAASLNTGNTLWVFAASGMFVKKIWDELGGLDELYNPAYWEDIDIGYRAWKQGYRCLFARDAEVFHEAEATMNLVLGGNKQVIAFRNQLLFFWKNIDDKTLIRSHLNWLPYHLTVTNWKTRGAFAKGFLQALSKRRKIKKSHKFVLSDQQIINESSQNV